MTKPHEGAAKLVAIAGSARKESFNRKLLAVAMGAARIAGAEVEVVELGQLDLPLYDSDREAAEGIPEPVNRFKERLRAAEGLIVAMPEYNHSIPGVFKNAIDWASRGEEKVFPGRSAALLAASPGGVGGMRGLAHLRQVLTALGMWIVPSQVTLSHAGSAFEENGDLKDSQIREQVDNLIAEMLTHISARRNHSG